MIDRLLSLTFNLHAQRGTYALLVGSGISRSASIPTGWEITLDLVAKLAHLQSEDCKGDEAKWYVDKFGRDPDYSELLCAVAPTAAAQQQLLTQYFEPTQIEREEGKKLPTVAHREIARLVSGGYIRVIMTTNFDRLLETALEAEGVAPVVIASADAAKGAPPLAHSKCTVIKVHGDYLDHRIKNSTEALSAYDPAMDLLLDQVFAEYGLIVSGWSAVYDIALRNALTRSKVRRYPMYWTALSEPTTAAQDLISLHSAQFVKIDGADAFFVTLIEKLKALEEFDRPHPISAQLAIVTLKRYLSEDKYRIQLRDLLIEEATQAIATVDSVFDSVSNLTPTKQSVQDFMKRIEAIMEKLISLFANGSFYARAEHVKAFFDAFYILAGTNEAQAGYRVWVDLKRYPALLLAYAAGISAIASENYALLAEIASKLHFAKDVNGRLVSAPGRFTVHKVMERDAARQLLEDMDRRYTPVSDYLFSILRPTFVTLIHDGEIYERAFDNFEYLWCLLHVDALKQGGNSHPWTPYGSFAWRWNRFEDHGRFSHQMKLALDNRDATCPPLKAGLFGADLNRLKFVKEFSDELLQRIRENFH